jgi:dipeptide/tripeptide permease
MEEDKSTGPPNEPINEDSINSTYDDKTNDKPGGVVSPKLKKTWGRVWCTFFRLPFPVFFIIWNEFCERFSYYGMRAVLVLFLKQFLNFEDDSATAIYHAFIVLCYLLPLVGAIISDSCLGKYSTIVSLSILYASGNVLMAVSAIPFNDDRGINIALTALALFVIAFGTGGIKPCVSAFGGDQFTEKKVDLLPVFFSVFYFSINAGSLISTLLTPVLRGYVQCFDENECFPLAFGVPAVLMIIAVVIFLLGTRWYIITKPKRKATSASLFFRVPISVVYAIYRRIKHGKLTDTRNFMDYATPKFSEQFVYDVWLFLRVLVMFIPLPIFWALFDQQGSRWTLQALRMNGRLGDFVILPDQVQSLNPIFIIVLIPIFESVIYPIFAKCKLLKKSLQRMAFGMAISGIAFVYAGLLEIYIQTQVDRLEAGQARVVISNALNEPVDVVFGNSSFNLLTAQTHSPIVTDKIGLSNVTFTVNGLAHTEEINVTDGHILQLFYTRGSEGFEVKMNNTKEWFPSGDKASITVFLGDLHDYSNSTNISFSLCVSGSTCEGSDRVYYATNLTDNDFAISSNVTIGNYDYIIKFDNDTITAPLPGRLESGGIYTIVVSLNSSSYPLIDLALANSPNSVSIFLQIPMYFIITVGEVLFSITGLEFAYSQV